MEGEEKGERKRGSEGRWKIREGEEKGERKRGSEGRGKIRERGKVEVNEEGR
jgi:hypothetical protein